MPAQHGQGGLALGGASGLAHQGGDMIKPSPNAVLAEGTDWRFLNQIKRELRAVSQAGGARAGKAGLTA